MAQGLVKWFNDAKGIASSSRLREARRASRPRTSRRPSQAVIRASGPAPQGAGLERV
jgi:hypothetical protein